MIGIGKLTPMIGLTINGKAHKSSRVCDLFGVCLLERWAGNRLN